MRMIKILIILLFLSGCQTGNLQQQICTVKVTHVLERCKLVDALESKACVFLAQVSIGQEQYSKSASNSLARVLKDNSNDLNVLSFSELVNEISEKEIYEEYSETNSFYKKNGMLRKSDLQIIGEKLDLDYFIVPIVLDIKRWDVNRFSAVGVKLLNTQKICVIVTMEIWNREGVNLFSATSDITIADERIKEHPISIEDAFDRAWLAIFQQFSLSNEEI